MRKSSHPRLVLRGGIFIGIAVANFGEVVVARIGICTLAIFQSSSQGIVIVALDALHRCLVEKREDSVGIRTKGAQVAKAVDAVHAPARNVPQGSLQGTVVVVDPTQNGEPSAHQASTVPSTEALRFWQNVPYW